jgi:hypothetical protein
MNIIVFSFFVFGYLLYPRYSSETNTSIFSAIQNLAGELPNFQALIQRFGDLKPAITYFGFFLIPIVLSKKFIFSSNRFVQSVILGFAALLAAVIVKSDVFSVGNILYVEGLYAKNSDIVFFNALNNWVFKLILSSLMSLSTIVLVVATFTKYLRARSETLTFLLLLVIGNMAILCLGSDLYDRYLLPSFVSALFLFALMTKEDNTTDRAVAVFLTTGYILFSFLLVFQYTLEIKTKWLLAADIEKAVNVKQKKLVDGTYTRYVKSRKNKDYTGRTYIDSNEHYLCFTSLEEHTPLPDATVKLRTSNEQYSLILGIPQTPSGYKYVEGKMPSKDNVRYLKTYDINLPAFWILGIDTKVTGWCPQEQKPPPIN